MMCYRDTTFCASPSCRNECGRQFTKEADIETTKWQQPIAFAYFCDADGKRVESKP